MWPFQEPHRQLHLVLWLRLHDVAPMISRWLFWSVSFSCLIIPCPVTPQVGVFFPAVMEWYVFNRILWEESLFPLMTHGWIVSIKGKKNLPLCDRSGRLNLLPFNRQIVFNCLLLFPPLNLLPVWAEGAVLIRPSGLVGRFQDRGKLLRLRRLVWHSRDRSGYNATVLSWPNLGSPIY